MLHSIIDNPKLAQAGSKRMEWYRDRMGVICKFKNRYEREQPFLGKKILVCMHCEPKGAVRTEVLLAGGAEEIIFIGNLGSTKPDVAAYLSTLPKVTVLARKNDTLEDLNSYVKQALEAPVDLFMDNGASIMLQYHKGKYDWKPIGAIEETRSGQFLLEKEKISPNFPVLVIDDSPVKRLVENEVGVGQSVVDGFMRATSMLMGGLKVLVIGYGYCGLGISQRFRALGALTMVYDISPLRMLKAKIEGHIVGSLDELVALADVVVTVTGRFDVIRMDHIQQMKNRTILCNAGHYNMEIDVKQMKEQAIDIQQMQNGIQKYAFEDKEIYLLQNANPINLSSGAGNPIEIMELGYALQLLSLEKLLVGNVGIGIKPLPDDINNAACELCLAAGE